MAIGCGRAPWTGRRSWRIAINATLMPDDRVGWLFRKIGRAVALPLTNRAPALLGRGSDRRACDSE
jgi:hypothetical protein